MIRKFILALGLVSLAGCGGGGGGGNNSDSTAGSSFSSPSSALVFSPSKVSVNYAAGTSATATVRTTVTDPGIFAGASAVYVYVVDSNKVLSGAAETSRIDGSTFSTTLHTSATLAAGHYQGSFQIQLCKDASCAAQFSGSPVALPYDFTVTASVAPLNAGATSSTQASMHLGAAAPNDVTVSVTGANLDWSAYTDASWLQISGGAGVGNGSFRVSYAPAGLAAGTYNDHVTVRSKDGQTSQIAFSLTVLPVQFSLTSGVPSFSAVNGAPIAAQTLSFELDNKAPAAWTATSSAAWMVASPLSGTTPGSMTLQPDPTRGPLASGAYSADIVLSSTGIPSKTVTSNLSLIKPTLSAPSASVTIGGSKGRDFSPQSLQISMNTGTLAWPWSMSALPAWLTSTTQSGTVNQSGTSLNFAPDLSKVTPGSVSGIVTVSAQVNGDTVNLPLTVNVNADQQRLLVSEWGVGFSSTPTGTAVTRTLTVSDNFGGALAWTASSDQSWLSVTASGTTGGASQITLTANPASLPSGAVSYALVTVATAASGVSPATVRVALWKDASGAVAMTKLPVDYAHLAADKIRPYVYANNGATSIDVYHAYTAQKIATISNVGVALGEMSVAPDGSKLYVLDTASRAMDVVDLTTMMKETTWSLDNAVDGFTSVLAIRPNGVEVVLVGDGTAYKNGRSLGPTGISGSLSASSDGRSVFAQDKGLSPASVYAFDVDYSEMSGGILMVSRRASGWSINGSSNGRDIAASPDGTHLYTATGAPYRCSSIDPADLSLIGSLPGGDAYPNNIEVASDGRVICGISGWYAASDFWVHTAAGALVQGYKVAGYAKALKDGQMAVTPDGFIVVTQTDDPVLAFVAIGP